MDRRHDKRLRRAHRQARHAAPHRHPSRDDALKDLAVGMDERHPLAFLAHTSGLWAVLTDTRLKTGEQLSPVDFAQSMIDVPVRETTALLTILRHFAGDPLLVLRIERELAKRSDRLPAWLESLGEVVIVRLARQTEPYRDGDQYWFELGWPDGTALSVGVLVDSNWGYAFKDLLLVPDGVAVVESVIAGHVDDTEGMTFQPISPADARAQIAEAVARSDMMFPPYSTESWPQGRPLLEWVLRMLPDGGTGFPDHDLEEPARQTLVSRFLASPDGQGLGPVAGETADTLVWFAGFNCGDPLRWSPTKIEFLLLDWWHRKVVQSEDDDRQLPSILRSFVRWSGQEHGLPARFIDQNVAAVDEFEPAFLAEIGTPRRNTAAELTRLVAGIPVDDDADEDDGLADAFESVLADRVGGWDVLDDLDAIPLPDEPLVVDGVDPDILPAVHAASLALDAEITSRSLPDATELRTAGRRLIRRLALTDPAAWRRKAAPASTACAIAYLLYDVNQLLRSTVPVKDLVASFGLKTAPQSRINGFRRAAFGDVWQGDASLMTGANRQQVLDLRDHWRTP